MSSLTRRERHFLGLLVEPGATIGIGLTVGNGLLRRRLVRVAKFGRLGITDAGRAALAEPIKIPTRPRRHQPDPRNALWDIF